MKKTRKIFITLLSFVLLLTLSFGVVACGGDDGNKKPAPKPPVYAITLNTDTLELDEFDEGAQLIATVTKDGIAIEATELVWASGNDDVVTVSDAGYVTVVGKGATAVTCTYDENHVASCNVIVNEHVYVYEVELDQTSLNFTYIDGLSAQLTASATVDGEADDQATFVWASDNDEVATVADGLVTIIGVGAANVTVTYNGVTATCVVNVEAFDPTGVVISLNKTELELLETDSVETLVFSATRDGVAIEDLSVLAWSSDNESVVTVDNGTLTVVGSGSATVTATYYGLTVTCDVTVREVWYEISSGDAFVELVKSNAKAKIKLTNNIEIKNASIAGGNQAVASAIAKEFNGIVDGQNYSIIISMNEAGRPNGSLFESLNGTVKNTNFVIRRNDWGPGNTHKGAGFIGTLNGTVENCIVTLYNTRYGTPWCIDMSIIEHSTENAVIKNTIVYIPEGSETSSMFIRNSNAGTKVENVAIVYHNWSTAYIASVSTVGDIDGLYLFSNLDNLIVGKPAHKYTNGLIVANNALINVYEVFGYSVCVDEVEVRAGTKEEDEEGNLIDNAQTLAIPNYFDVSAYSISLDIQTLSLTEKSEAVKLTATVKEGETEVEDASIIWTSSDDKVASVENGLVTPKTAGNVTISAIYFGLTVSCVVTIEAAPVEINSVADFIREISSGNTGTYVLKSDIVLTDTNLDAESTFQTPDATFSSLDFAGVLDGDGHTITLNIKTADRGTNWGFFPTISGTIKNVNFVVNNSSYYGGSRYGILAVNLNGSIENCIINFRNVGHGGGYGYPTLFRTMGADAEIKNTLINIISGSYINHVVAENASATSKITNVAVVSSQFGWAAASGMRLDTALPVTKCNVSGFYLYTSVANALNGSAAWVLNAQKYANPENPANVKYTDDASTEVLYDRNQTAQLVDVIGFNVVNESLPVILSVGDTESTFNGFDFAPVAAE